MSYGCHNREPFHPYHHAQDGYHPMSKPEAASRLPNIIKVPHVMTSECQYTKTELGQTDPKCVDCKHKET